MSIKGTYGDPKLMYKLANYRMPFGKYFDMPLIDLPPHYLAWFSQKGFPQTELGQLMQIIHETRLNGMEGVLEQVRKKHQNSEASGKKQST